MMYKDLYKSLFDRIRIELYRELGFDAAMKIINRVIDEEAKEIERDISN